MSVAFTTLWKNHPSVLADSKSDPSLAYPCVEKEFPNQCAIRMGVCLNTAGVKLVGYTGRRCYPDYSRYLKDHKGKEHILAAEDLAKWLNMPVTPFGQAIKYPSLEAMKNIGSSKGIIFFKDFWRRRGEANPSGDHIDLWNGARMTDKASTGLASSYAAVSTYVLFWEVK